jgi:hypothetical protein
MPEFEKSERNATGRLGLRLRSQDGKRGLVVVKHLRYPSPDGKREDRDCPARWTTAANTRPPDSTRRRALEHLPSHGVHRHSDHAKH